MSQQQGRRRVGHVEGPDATGAAPLLLPPATLEVAGGWLVALEVGSAGISLSDLTRDYYRLRFGAYAATRVLVTLHSLWVFATCDDAATAACCAMSLPLVAHNFGVARRMWRRL